MRPCESFAAKRIRMQPRLGVVSWSTRTRRLWRNSQLWYTSFRNSGPLSEDYHMAIAKKPDSKLNATRINAQQKAFIQGAGKSYAEDQNKKPVMIRVDPDLLIRIDRAAKRRGISRSAFIVSAATKELEQME
jgi:hypothetical protein